MALPDQTAEPVLRFQGPGPTGGSQPWMNRAPLRRAGPGLVIQHPGSRSFPWIDLKGHGRLNEGVYKNTLHSSSWHMRNGQLCMAWLLAVLPLKTSHCTNCHHRSKYGAAECSKFFTKGFVSTQKESHVQTQRYIPKLGWRRPPHSSPSCFQHMNTL